MTAKKTTVSLTNLIKTLDDKQINAFRKDMITSIRTFLDMSYEQEMTDNDLVNYLIQSTKGIYGSCEIVTASTPLLVSSMQKYNDHVRVVNGSMIHTWVRRISEGHDANHVVGYSINNCRTSFKRKGKVVSLRQFIGRLDDNTFSSFKADLIKAITSFIAMGSNLVMSEDIWVNYLIQASNNSYGWCEEKVNHRTLLSEALLAYDSNVYTIYTDEFIYMISNALRNNNVEEAVSERLNRYR